LDNGGNDIWHCEFRVIDSLPAIQQSDPDIHRVFNVASHIVPTELEITSELNEGDIRMYFRHCLVEIYAYAQDETITDDWQSWRHLFKLLVGSLYGPPHPAAGWRPTTLLDT
jgi:hypothetical protein